MAKATSIAEIQRPVATYSTLRENSTAIGFQFIQNDRGGTDDLAGKFLMFHKNEVNHGCYGYYASLPGPLGLQTQRRQLH
jgi:hypothetical protein